jgi:hypothetical protein
MFNRHLSYAETHFKFKLPSSFLFKKEPELLVDAPYQVLTNKHCPVFIISKDAHKFPHTIKEIRYHIQGPGQSITKSVAINLFLDQALSLHKIPIEIPANPGSYQVNIHLLYEDARGKKKECINWNYSGIPSMPLIIQRLSHHLPWGQSWKAGEMHCHSSFTSDPIEFGAPIQAFHESAIANGLDFTCITDHSYNFQYDSTDYMRKIPTHKKWNAFQKELQKYSDDVALISGEEISCGNSLKQNVHMLGFGMQNYVEGLGDGGRRWLNNKPTHSIAEAIERSPDALHFAAHPKARIGTLERLLINRGIWSEKDILPGLHGLQFWNGSRDSGYYKGRKFWIEQLLQGKKLLPIGGNDAHGDLNRAVAINMPLISLKCHRAHIFGRVKSVVQSSTNQIQDLKEGFLEERMFCSDGPYLFMPNANVVESTSSNDFGKLTKLYCFRGYFSQKTEEHEVIACDTMAYREEVDWKNADYLRWECITEKGFFALSAPKWRTL